MQELVEVLFGMAAEEPNDGVDAVVFVVAQDLGDPALDRAVQQQAAYCPGPELDDFVAEDALGEETMISVEATAIPVTSRIPAPIVTVS